MSDYGDGSDDKYLYVPVSRKDFSDTWKLSERNNPTQLMNILIQ